MADEVHRLVVQAVGDEEQRRLQKAVDDARTALQAETRAAYDIHPAFARASAAVKDHAAALIQAEKSLKAHQAAMAQAGAQSGTLTQSISTLGFTINDADQFNVSFAAGMRSVSNNIPGIATAMQNLAQVGFKGVMTALSGPAGIILGLTALSSLLPLIQSGWAAIQDAWSGGETEKEAERMERLSKATEKTAAERDKLNKYEREKSTLGQLEKSEPAEVRQTRRIIEEAVVESGFTDTAEALARARNPQGRGSRLSAADQIQLERLQSHQNLPGAGGAPSSEFIAKFRREAEQRAYQAEIERARIDISKAVANPQQAVGLVNEFRKGGLNDAADRIQSGLRFQIEKEDNDLLKAIRDVEEADRKESVAKYEEDVALMKAIREVEEADRKKAIAAYDEDVALHRAAREVQAQDRKEEEKIIRENTKIQLESAKAFGLDKLATQAALGGAGVGEVEEYFRSRYGLSAEAAGEIALSGSQAASRDLLTRQDPRRPSEITSDIHADIQRGVQGDDIQKKSLQVAEEMRTYMKEVAVNTKRDWAGRPVIVRGKHAGS